MTPWTTLEIADVVRLWNDGYAASQIALKIGRTRNSVIGVVFRQKLASRTTQIRSRPAPLTQEEKEARSVKRTATLAVRRQQFTEMRPLNVSLLDLKPHHCRFPYGDGPHFFCGATVKQFTSYCPYHHSVCYGRPAATPEQIEQARKARFAKNRVYGRAA